MKNRELANIFAAMANILAIQDASVHRIRAYRRASESIAALGQPIEQLWTAGELDTIAGIGETLAAKIDEYLREGRIEAYQRLRQDVPPGVVEMLDIDGVGPKRAALFWRSLGVTSVDELADAARQEKLAPLEGMGKRSEANVLEAIERLRRRTDRIPLGTALPLAEDMLASLRKVRGVERVSPAGSLRRGRESVGDIDLLVAAAGADRPNADVVERVMDAFCGLPHVANVVMRGATKSTVRTHDGLQVDLRLIESQRWGTALQYFTGSQAHNIRLRGIAQSQSLSLSEYAYRREDGSEIVCPTEDEVYAAAGVPWIPPEIREDRGEIEAARRGTLPALVELGDLRGDLHVHTSESDGMDPLLDMARAAREHGLAYAVISDHTWSLGVAGGLSADELRAQRGAIEAANDALGGDFTLLAGAEVEVRSDGSLDFADDVLAELDIVVASVHSGLRQSRGRLTSRMLAAIRNPHVDVVAHPTGRLIGEREPADIDLDAIFHAAAETGTALEVNSWPRRLDLKADHVRRALEHGVKIAIGSDAHHTNGFADLRYGVATARRGWATRPDVVNAWSLQELLRWAARSGAS